MEMAEGQEKSDSFTVSTFPLGTREEETQCEDRRRRFIYFEVCVVLGPKLARVSRK